MQAPSSQPAISALASSRHRQLTHDAFLLNRGGIHEVYSCYRKEMMLTQRRTSSTSPTVEQNDALVQRAGRLEEEFCAQHATRLCSHLHTVRAALTSHHNPATSPSGDRSTQRCGGEGWTSPPLALVGRTDRTNSVASTTELMELFRSDRLNPKSASTSPGPEIVVTASPDLLPQTSTHVYQVPAMLTSTTSTSTMGSRRDGALGVPNEADAHGVHPAAPSQVHPKPTSSPLPPPHNSARRSSSTTTTSNRHERRQANKRLSTFAKRRIGQLLADVVIACSCIAEGAQLENIEQLIAGPPVLVLSTPSNGETSPDSSKARASGGGHPWKHGSCAFDDPLQSSNIHNMLRNAKSFVSGVASMSGHERRLSDLEGESSAPPPFLNFDVVNSAEDLTAFEDDGSDWDSGSQIPPRCAGGAGGADGLQHAPHSVQYQKRKYHAPIHSTQHNTGASNSQSASPSSGIHPPPMGSALPPAHASSVASTLLSPHSNSTSQRLIPVPHRGGGGANRGGRNPSGGDQPRSPGSSILFRPALSFTSVESPRNRRPPSASPQFHSSLSPPADSMTYSVDEARLQVFLKSLHDVVRMVATGTVTAHEFTEIGLRYIVPGLFSMSRALSAAPTPQQIGMFVPPALSMFLHDQLFLPPPVDGSGVPAITHTDPLGLPPKVGSLDGLDGMVGAGAGASSGAGGQVSRMSSFRLMAASPTAESVAIVENGHQRVVTLAEFPIFLAAVQKILMDADAATGSVYSLSEQFRQAVH